uniref:Uncharacterized protein n=1 Tax=Anguilla anguilla TaxID=7936 RepID=A0A0E9V2Y1_ANGAN
MHLSKCDSYNVTIVYPIRP